MNTVHTICLTIGTLGFIAYALVPEIIEKVTAYRLEMARIKFGIIEEEDVVRDDDLDTDEDEYDPCTCAICRTSREAAEVIRAEEGRKEEQMEGQATASDKGQGASAT